MGKLKVVFVKDDHKKVVEFEDETSELYVGQAFRKWLAKEYGSPNQNGASYHVIAGTMGV